VRVVVDRHGGDQHGAVLRPPGREVQRRIVGAVLGIDHRGIARLLAQIDEGQLIDLGQALIILHAPHIAAGDQHLRQVVPPARAVARSLGQIDKAELSLADEAFRHGHRKRVRRQVRGFGRGQADVGKFNGTKR
jgi:hypothetical protein